jgi:hypothetical protein
VFAALAVSRWIESQTGRSIRRFVKTARRYRTIQIQAGQHTITAAAPLPDDLRQARVTADRRDVLSDPPLPVIVRSENRRRP